MKTITKDVIENYGTFKDRENCFDDKKESDIFIRFLEQKYGDKFVILEKPFGQYGIDIGVFAINTPITENNIKVGFDLERCKTWDKDCPSFWKCLSFLGRKDKYFKLNQFGMVWFSQDLSKFVISWKKDIQKYPLTQRNFKGKSYTDSVREVQFSDGKLFGTGFTEFEKKLFTNRVECVLK